MTSKTDDRSPSDEVYCPAVSCVMCGLPEYHEVQLGLKSTPQKIWACHSNSAIPCVATGLNSFPKGSIRFTESEEFLDSLDKEYGLQQCSQPN